MKAISIRDLEIGVGSPKIVVSIVEKSKENIIEKAIRLIDMKMDLVEWRADFYKDPLNIYSVLDILYSLRSILGDIPLLFTFRSRQEGGEGNISMEQYTKLNREVANSGKVDLIDLEMFSGDDIVKENISNIHKAGVAVIGSNHDFLRTPEKEEIIYRLKEMQAMGADILKLALMPNNPKDVIRLLDATNDMYSKYADRPLVTISMGSMGLISRIAGETFGSAITFASVGQESAPGQIPLDELAHILGIIHKNVK